MVLAEPLRVSPLIKTCRWGALLVGVWWGNKRWQANKATEDEHRAYLAKMQPIWDAEKAEKAAKVRMLLFLWTCIVSLPFEANRENMIYLAKATGTPIPADF